MGFEDAQEFYDRAKLGQRMLLGQRPIVLVVDFSLGFTDTGCVLGSDCSVAVAATRQLLDATRAKGFRSIFTTIAFVDPESHPVLWMRKIPALQNLRSGSRWVLLDPALERLPTEPVLTKQGASAFFGTELEEILRDWEIDSVLLCGTTTSGCVRATAVDLLQNGYPTWVVRECVADRAVSVHEANLFDMDKKYADVVPLKEALDYIQSLTPPQ